MNIKMICCGILSILLMMFSLLNWAEKSQNTQGNNSKNTTAKINNQMSGEVINNQNVYTEDKLNILVSPNQPEFSLKLKSNPSTGYSWFLRDYDTHLIEPIKHYFTAPTKELIGASGYEIWTFRVKPEGFIVPQQTTVRMTYARPWEKLDTSTQVVFHVSTEAAEEK